MGARTATATALDSARDSYLAALDAYLLEEGQGSESGGLYTAKYEWRVLLHHLRTRTPMRRLIDSGPRLPACQINKTTLVTTDRHAA